MRLSIRLCRFSKNKSVRSGPQAAGIQPRQRAQAAALGKSDRKCGPRSGRTSPHNSKDELRAAGSRTTGKIANSGKIPCHRLSDLVKPPQDRKDCQHEKNKEGMVRNQFLRCLRAGILRGTEARGDVLGQMSEEIIPVASKETRPTNPPGKVALCNRSK